MVANKHQQKTAATRRRLFAAALRVFARDGFEASRLADIAKESGHTRGAFYANFDTKEDLFFALVEQQADEKLRDLTERLERQPTMKGRIQTVRDYYLERAGDRQSVLLTLEFKLFALRHPKMQARMAAAHRRIRASLAYQGLKKLSPWPETKDTELDRILLEVGMSGLVLEHAHDPERLSREQVTEALGRLFDLVLPPVNEVRLPSASRDASTPRAGAARPVAR